MPLTAEGDGYFSGLAADSNAGAHYKYEVDHKEAYPDPASRYQPSGPHRLLQGNRSAKVRLVRWRMERREVNGQVIYELHLGTFTPGGTWFSAAEKLQYLHDTGITLIEVMPVADFPGKFGWGYDGVQPYAPASIYGTPDEMRALSMKAHGLGLGVVLTWFTTTSGRMEII